MFCGRCGSDSDAGAQFCSRCGNPLGNPAAAGPALPAMPYQGPASSAAPPQQRVIVVRSGKSSGLAAVLSFFWCGLGQIYNGQIAKGLIMGFLYFLSFLAIFILIGIITTPILWIWGMYDAYSTAERLNREAGLA